MSEKCSLLSLSPCLNLYIHTMINLIISRVLSSMKFISHFFHCGRSIKKPPTHHFSVVILGHHKLNLVTEIRASNFQREISLKCPSHFTNVWIIRLWIHLSWEQRSIILVSFPHGWVLHRFRVFFLFYFCKKTYSFRWVIAVTVQTPLLCFKEINEFIKNGVPFSYTRLWQRRCECGPHRESYSKREFISLF